MHQFRLYPAWVLHYQNIIKGVPKECLWIFLFYLNIQGLFFTSKIGGWREAFFTPKNMGEELNSYILLDTEEKYQYIGCQMLVLFLIGFRLCVRVLSNGCYWRPKLFVSKTWSSRLHTLPAWWVCANDGLF